MHCLVNWLDYYPCLILGREGLWEVLYNGRSISWFPIPPTYVWPVYLPRACMPGKSEGIQFGRSMAVFLLIMTGWFAAEETYRVWCGGDIDKVNNVFKGFKQEKNPLQSGSSKPRTFGTRIWCHYCCILLAKEDTINLKRENRYVINKTRMDRFVLLSFTFFAKINLYKISQNNSS